MGKYGGPVYKSPHFKDWRKENRAFEATALGLTGRVKRWHTARMKDPNIIKKVRFRKQLPRKKSRYFKMTRKAHEQAAARFKAKRKKQFAMFRRAKAAKRSYAKMTKATGKGTYTLGRGACPQCGACT